MATPVAAPSTSYRDALPQNGRWLVTGVAGFIGSNLLERLLRADQAVVGLDNLATGKQSNLDKVKGLVTEAQWSRFTPHHGDICNIEDCRKACAGAEYVLHQAALGSVPRSLAAPLNSHASNVDGFINMLQASREASVSRFVYASSSSVYGDHPALPKVEDKVGRVLSPYAATKSINELYAEVFHRCYGLPVVGLRYFNVFGPRQDTLGAYAAVIPRWIKAIESGESVAIFGDGETSRDFCFIENVVQANILAATRPAEDVAGQVFNIAAGSRTTLNELFEKIKGLVLIKRPSLVVRSPTYSAERAGDVRHSLADIGKARSRLGYNPSHDIDQGLAVLIDDYFGIRS